MMLQVTGIGAISALGDDAASLFAGLTEGRRGLSPEPPPCFDGYRTGWLGSVRSVRSDSLERGESRTARMALTAAAEAMAHAALDPASRRVGLVVGGSTAGMLETEGLLVTLADERVGGDERAAALAGMLSHPLSSVTEWVASRLGPFALVATTSSACSSGVTAVVVGATWLAQGLVDAVVVGAADGLCRVALAGFGALGAIDSEPCRPFDRRRRGLSLGEGAAFLVVERAAEAAHRGAHPLADLAGWGLVAEAHHITNPEASGVRAARAIEAALARAGVGAGAVDWVSAHGTGTKLNDSMECRAVQRVLGAHAASTPMSSIKGSIGHTLAAAGALEAVAAVQSIVAQRLLPTAGLEQVDDECPARHVTTCEAATVEAVVSSSFAFGGMDGALVLTAPGRARTILRAAPSLVVCRVVTLDAHGERWGASCAEATSEAEAARPLAVALAELDGARARRMDRASLLATVAVGAVLDGVELEGDEVGVVVGSAFGRADATAAFMGRVHDRGPRFASPLEFPSLVPSGTAGHVSVYHRLGGGALATADLAASGEAAFCLACDLLAAGEVTACVSGATEEQSRIVEHALAALFATAEAGSEPRGEGASALLLVTEERAAEASLTPMARVAAWRRVATRDARSLVAPLGPAARSRVVVGRLGEGAGRWLARSSWRDVPLRTLAPERGTHEALGAFALAEAAALVASGESDRVLVVGEGAATLYVVVLER